MDHPTPQSRLVGGGHCSHLRHKGMYVTSGPGADDASFGVGPYDATAYWCTQTMKGLGPDGQPVHADRCRPETDRCCCVR